MGVILYVSWLVTPVAAFGIGYWVGWRDGKGVR